MATPHNSNSVLAANNLPEFRCPFCQTLLGRLAIQSGIISMRCHRCSKALKSTVVILIEIVPKPPADEPEKDEAEKGG
jgi:hypothetical protein